MFKQKPLKAAESVSWFQCNQGWAVSHAAKPPIESCAVPWAGTAAGLGDLPPSLQALGCKAGANWFSAGQTEAAPACLEPVLG